MAAKFGADTDLPSRLLQVALLEFMLADAAPCLRVFRKWALEPPELMSRILNPRHEMHTATERSLYTLCRSSP
eukprot:2515762-Pleurochrysis_carterae.AAC.2